MEDMEFEAPEQAAMEKLLAAHAHDAVGVVLRLAWYAGLKRKEIAALTWPEVDFTEGVLRLPDREKTGTEP